MDTEKKVAANQLSEPKTQSLLLFTPPKVDNVCINKVEMFCNFVGYSSTDDSVLDGFRFCQNEALIEKKSTLGQNKC